MADPPPAPARPPPAHAADLPPWSELPGLFDQTWYLQCSLSIAMRRVFKRQTSQGVPPAASKLRIQGNDRQNALEIARTQRRAGYQLRTQANTWISRRPRKA